MLRNTLPSVRISSASAHRISTVAVLRAQAVENAREACGIPSKHGLGQLEYVIARHIITASFTCSKDKGPAGNSSASFWIS